MTLSEGALLIPWLFLIVAVMGGLFWFIPWCLLSQYRYRLWRLRDGIKDDLIFDRLPQTPPVLRVVDALECSIRYASSLTVTKMAGLVLVARERDHERGSYVGLTVEQVGRVRGYEEQLTRQTARHLLLGTPAGWLVLIAMLPTALIASLVQHRRWRGVAIERVEVRMPEQSGIWAVAYRHDAPEGDDETLAACAG